MPPRSEASLGETLAALRRQWGGLAPWQRRSLAAAGAVAVTGLLVWAAVTARGPAMAPLFTNLAPQDGAAIVTQLQHSHTPYALADNGQTILVPVSQVDALRLQMAGLGLPNQGNVGLNSVLNLPFGATDFTRQVAYQNALQDELASTIESIQGVQSARVAIVLPSAPTFGGGGSPASAAVLVALQPGIQLTPGQVAGIVHLVAASVQGLDPSNVTVLDQTGQILSDSAALAAGGGTAGSVGTAGLSGPAAQASLDLQVEQAFDDTLQRRLQALLDQVFGPGNVVAQVQSQLNFDSGTVQRTLFSPGGSRAVLQSMQQLKQSVTGQGAAATLPAGTAANSFPPTYGQVGQGGSSSSTSDQLTQNFDVSQENDTTTVAPGALSRLSVAVVVNGALTAAQARLVRATVEAAVGYDPARHDQISVVGLPFNQALLNRMMQQPLPTAGGLLARPWLVPALAAAVPLVAVAAFVLGRRRRAEPDAAPPPAAEGAADADGLGAELPLVDGDVGATVQAARAARQRMEAALRDRPEDVARVIRAWMAEDG